MRCECRFCGEDSGGEISTADGDCLPLRRFPKAGIPASYSDLADDGQQHGVLQYCPLYAEELAEGDAESVADKEEQAVSHAVCHCSTHGQKGS